MLIDTAASRREISKLGRKLTETIVNSQISDGELHPASAPPPPLPSPRARLENVNARKIPTVSQR